MLDFSVNINPFGPPRSLLKTLKENIHVINNYPDHLNTDILSALKNFLRVPLKNIALGVGSTQILFDVPKMLCYKRAIIIVPTFWEYTVFNSFFQKKIKKIVLHKKNGFKPYYNLIQETIKPNDCVFICNINNPTSVLYDKKELLKLIQNNPKVQFIVDETYLVFRNDFTRQSLLKQATKNKNLYVIISLSKFFSIPGVRLGILVTDNTTIKMYNKQFHIPYSISPFSVIVFNHILKNKAFINKTRVFYDTERARLFNTLNQKLKGKLRCFKPEGSFIIGRILTKQSSKSIKESLKKKGILIRGGHELSDLGDDWIRFSIRSSTDNNILVNELDSVLKRNF